MSDFEIEKLLGLYQSYVDEFDYKEICRIWVDYDEVMDDIILNVFFSKRMAIDYGGRLTAISNRIIDEIGKKFFNFVGVKPKLYIHYESCNKINETKKNTMKKVVRLTESQLVSIISDVASNKDNKIDEQIVKMLKNLISPSVKPAARTTRQVTANAGTMTKQLLSKFGVVKYTSYIRDLIKPIENEVAVILNDVKRINSMKKPLKMGQPDYVAFLNTHMYSVQRELKPINNKINFDMMYTQIKDIENYISNIKTSGNLNRDGMVVLKEMEKNVADALKGIDNALAQMASKF
jgi:hypothetical protein